MLIARVVRRIGGQILAPFLEWQSTAQMLILAFVIGTNADHTFASNPAFRVMQHFGDESFWSAGLVLVAFVRIFALVASRRTRRKRLVCPVIRSTAAFIGAFGWMSVFLGIVGLSDHSLSVGMYGVAAVMDFFVGMMSAQEAGEVSVLSHART